MATRENQTLQIALMVFAILLVVFAVLTYWFWKSWDDQLTKNEQLESDLSNERSAQNSIRIEANQYKLFMGFQEQDNFDAVKEGFQKDMDLYAADLSEEEQKYNIILERLDKENKQSLIREEDANKKRKELEKTLLTLEAQHAAQIKQQEAEATSAKQDLAAERAVFNEQRAKHKERVDELTQENEKARDNYEKQLAEKENKITTLAADLETVEKQRDQLLKELRRGQPEPQFEVADGRVTWINQRQRILWINLGSADRLVPQLNFSIFDEGQPISTREEASTSDQSSDSSSPSDTKEKGKIEITRILDEHLAEARILSDNLSNPIMPGDQVYSPAWHRGKQTHFALGGILDLDGDGKSDLVRAKEIIRLNGGTIDEYVSDEGKLEFDTDSEEKGISINTRFLVLGLTPTPDPRDEFSQEIHKNTADLRTRARKLGIDEINLQQFLNLMGWKTSERTVPLGRAARAEDFPPQHEGGGQPLDVGGSTSELFQKRFPKPPY